MGTHRTRCSPNGIDQAVASASRPVSTSPAASIGSVAKNISAARAREILLVNEVFKSHEDLLEGAEKTALEIAESAPLAVRASKDVLNHGVGKSIDDGLKYVASLSANIIPSDDLTEAVSAFAEKRKPRFTGA